MTPEVRDHIEKCWRGGLSIGATRASLRKRFPGNAVTTEDIRHQFARHSHEW